MAASRGLGTQVFKGVKKTHEKVSVVGVAVEIRTNDNTSRKGHLSNQPSRRSDSRTESTVTHFSIKIWRWIPQPVKTVSSCLLHTTRGRFQAFHSLLRNASTFLPLSVFVDILHNKQNPTISLEGKENRLTAVPTTIQSPISYCTQFWFHISLVKL